MKKVTWILCLLLIFCFNIDLLAQETEDETAATEETEESVQQMVITNKEQLKAAIQAVGLENALKQALSQGVLNGQDITSAALETGNNPTAVISTLIVAGVPQNDVVVAANDFGIAPGAIGEGIREGVQERQRQIQATAQSEETGEAEEEVDETAAEATREEVTDETEPAAEEAEGTGAIIVDTTLTDDTPGTIVEDTPPPPPPDIISGLPGGIDPVEPISKVIP